MTLGTDPDLTLVEQAASGRADAFDDLYRRYYDRVYAIAMGVLLDPDEAADASQEVFALVFKNLKRFDRRARFSTWLFRIAVNRSIQQSRSRRKWLRSSSLDDVPEIAGSQDLDGMIADPAVQRVMHKLAAPDRAVLTLYYWEELSLPEIGESLGCTANAAKTRLFRARERFRSLFEEESI